MREFAYGDVVMMRITFVMGDHNLGTQGLDDICNFINGILPILWAIAFDLPAQSPDERHNELDPEICARALKLLEAALESGLETSRAMLAH